MKKYLLMPLLCLIAFAANGQQKQRCAFERIQNEHALHPPAHSKPVLGHPAAKTTSGLDTNTYDLPFVVHITHDYDVENIPDDTIFAAFEYWANDFMKQNADTVDVINPFKPYIGNAKMRFHLASKAPDGSPTKGITRRQSYLTDGGDNQAKFDGWPSNKYVNIWFTRTSYYATAYAYYPYMGEAEPFYDGVLSMAVAANTERVIQHELGHYFFLPHIWGSGACGTSCASTDTVDDTPPTKGHPFSCTSADMYDVSCSAGYLVHYTDITGADSIVNYPDTNNTQNIMDYSFCMNMFTKGQCHRMRTALTGPVGGRNNLITPSNLASTGALSPRPDLPPVADFTVNRAVGASLSDIRTYFLTVGNTASFQFKNASWNDTISAVSWSFSNGPATPTSTSMTTVNNQFSVPGWVSVSLTATSNAGTNTITKPNTVYAADTTPVGGDGYYQPFGNIADISNWPMFNYYNNPFRWEFYTGAGKGDNSCIRFRSFDVTSSAAYPRLIGTASGDFDDVCTPAFNLAGLTGNLYINFHTAAAATNAGMTGSLTSWIPDTRDTLEVFATTNGGAQWFKIGSIGGDDLTNNGWQDSEFLPGASVAWSAKSVAVPSVYRKRNTFFRLRFRPGSRGNNMYLDDFSISPFAAGVQELLARNNNTFAIMPNPTKNTCHLVFMSGR